MYQRTGYNKKKYIQRTGYNKKTDPFPVLIFSIAVPWHRRHTPSTANYDHRSGLYEIHTRPTEWNLGPCVSRNVGVETSPVCVS